VSKKLLFGIACLCCQAFASLQSQAANVYFELYPLTGELRLENRAATPFSFVFYSIDSTSAVLDPSKWTSISDTYDLSGNKFIDATHDWNKISATSAQLAEGVVPGSGGTLLPFRSIGLGRAWNPNTVPIDYLNIHVKQPNGTDADVSKVLMVDGDYAFDGIVDQTDFAFWSINFGSTEPTSDGNHNGIVDAADYTIWRDNLGAHRGNFSLGQASALGGLAAVPEPSGVMLALLAGGALVQVRLRRNSGC
jgi:hypothetical protein